MADAEPKKFLIYYTGPPLEEGDPLLDAASEKLADLTPFTPAQARRRFSRSPFTIISGLRHYEALTLLKELKETGLQAELQQDEHIVPEAAAEEITPCHRTEGKYITRGSGRALISELSTGLLILAVLAATGLMQIILALTLFAGEEPMWSLSASGWITFALVILGFFLLLTLKSKRIAGIISAPDQDSPIGILASYLRAINDRHWMKAASCLARRPGDSDLAGRGHDAVMNYLKDLNRAYVINAHIDPARTVFLERKGPVLTMRTVIQLMNRKPQAEGSRVQHELNHVVRLVLIHGRWYILDAEIMGQRSPARLPVPGCPECGVEIMPGQIVCQNCQSPLPAFSQASEKWISPRKKPDLAALLSAVIPGLGQVYNGQLLKGLLIGATSWLILPWLVGVVDASIVADRINRKQSMHDLPSNAGLNMSIYTGAFAVFLVLLILNASNLPVLSELLETQQEPGQQNLPETVVSRFKGADGNYAILFPFSWNVEVPDKLEFNRAGEHVALRAASEDGETSIIITTKTATPNWQPCPAAIEARRLMEEQMMEVANVECGTEDGRKQYRLDSFSPDRSYRQSLTVIGFANELVIIAFACPVEDQTHQVQVYNAVVDSIRYVETSGITVIR